MIVNMKPFIFCSIVACIFIRLLLLESYAQQMPPSVVSTAEAVVLEMAPTLWVSGTVVGRYDSRLAVEIEGLIEKIPEVGEQFNKNDVIATVKSHSYRLKRQEIASQIAPIQAELDFYTAEVKRLESLAEKNNAAKNRLDELRAERDKSKGEIRRIRAQLAVADDELSKTRIKAPFKGIVTERFKSLGEQVSEGEPLLRLVDLERSEIQAWIPEESLSYVHSGNELDIRYKDIYMSGLVRSMIPVADSRSRMYELRLENPNDYWSIGHAVQVQIPNGEKKHVLAVPRDALVIRSQGIHIYRVNSDNKAEMIRVKIGASQHNNIEVLGELQAGDSIVVRGNERLFPGAQVIPHRHQP